MENPFFHEKACAYDGCGRAFRTRIKRQRYCSDRCWFRANAAKRRPPRWPRWTPQEIRQLREMAGQVSPAEIAKRLGRTPLAVQTRAKYLKISLIRYGDQHPHVKYSDALVEQARQLHDEGMGRRAIAKRLGIPEATIRSFIEYKHRLGPCPERW